MAIYLLYCFVSGTSFVSRTYILCETNMLEAEYNHNFEEIIEQCFSPLGLYQNFLVLKGNKQNMEKKGG